MKFRFSAAPVSATTFLLFGVSVIALFITTRTNVILAAGNQSQRDTSGQRPRQSNPEEREQQGKDDPIKLGTDLVLLDVTVVDPSNRPVMDLTKDNFLVTEDKAPQKVEFFSREKVPISVVFTIDTSGSMRAKLDTVIKACVNLVKEAQPGDEMAVVEFKDQPELLEEFTTDPQDVIYTLQGLVASRQTAVLDALYLSADYASKEAKNRRKAVILVTDGIDNNSFYKFGEVVDRLRERDAQVYLIGYISDLDRGGGLFGSTQYEKAEKLLKRLANETGGRAFFPKELGETHAIAEQISTDLRTQYSIGYYPTNSKRDGRFREVKVQVNAGDRRLVARTRNGYTAPREGATRIDK